MSIRIFFAVTKAHSVLGNQSAEGVQPYRAATSGSAFSFTVGRPLCVHIKHDYTFALPGVFQFLLDLIVNSTSSSRALERTLIVYMRRIVKFTKNENSFSVSSNPVFSAATRFSSLGERSTENEWRNEPYRVCREKDDRVHRRIKYNLQLRPRNTQAKACTLYACSQQQRFPTTLPGCDE